MCGFTITSSQIKKMKRKEKKLPPSGRIALKEEEEGEEEENRRKVICIGQNKLSLLYFGGSLPGPRPWYLSTALPLLFPAPPHQPKNVP